MVRKRFWRAAFPWEDIELLLSQWIGAQPWTVGPALLPLWMGRLN